MILIGRVPFVVPNTPHDWIEFGYETNPKYYIAFHCGIQFKAKTIFDKPEDVLCIIIATDFIIHTDILLIFLSSSSPKSTIIKHVTPVVHLVPWLIAFAGLTLKLLKYDWVPPSNFPTIGK